MSNDEGGWKRRLLNTAIGYAFIPLYPFKKMIDYSKELDEMEDELDEEDIEDPFPVDDNKES